MSKKINKKIIFIFMISFIFILSMSRSAGAVIIGTDAVPESGSGTESDPYVYTVDATSKVTWKHLLAIGENQEHEIYQVITDGVVQYSWYYPPDICKNPAIYGPYFLGINKYTVADSDNMPGGSSNKSLYFSFALKRDFPGQVKITLFVADKYKDGTVLNLKYYGGYDATVVHGDSPLIMSDEIYDNTGVEMVASGITVSGGYATFYVRHGGNYYLISSEEDKEVNNNDTGSSNVEIASTDNSNNRVNSSDSNNNVAASNETISVPVYEDEVVIGKFGEIFSGKIAEVVANYFGKTIEDTVTQGDLNSIKKLYLADMDLDSLDELGKYNFGGLEQITASGNNLVSIPKLQAPMISYLDLSNNKIVDVSGLSTMTTLENINLSRNLISNMIDIAGFSKLTTLDLSYNKLTMWSAGMKSDSLRYLNLTGNKFTKEIDTAGLTNLEELEYEDKVKEINTSEIATSSIKKEGKEDNSMWIFILVPILIIILLVIFIKKKSKAK